jgi:hypothetical protein
MLHTYDLWRPKHTALFKALAVTNGGFAIAVVCVWTIASIILADPISWATWSIIERGDASSLLRYPINLLWMLPVVSLLSGWAARRAHKERLALGLMTLPILLFGLTIIMYHLLGLYGMR